MPDDGRLIIPAAAFKAEMERRKRLKALKQDCEEDLLTFIRAFWHVMEPETELKTGWVLETLCDLLMAVTDGHHQRVIINIPPGSGKSLVLCVFWPAWEWGPCNMPHLRYISASYNEALPQRDNDRFSRLIQHPDYQRFWGDRVSVTAAAKSLVENERTGWKRTSSTGGGTTGWRGDRVLIDDANNPKDVESDVVRQSTNQWLTEVMPDRLNDLSTGVIVNLQQRTHEEDATGTLAKAWREYTWLVIPMKFDPMMGGCTMPVVLRRDEDGEPIQVYRDPRGLDDRGHQLPGLFEDKRGKLQLQRGSPMALAEGELCWPERFGPEEVSDLERIKQVYAFAGQYQQSPTVRGGNIIRRDWWQVWPHPDFPPLGTVIASLDTAIKEGETNDYNAFTSWGAFALENGPPKLMLTSAWKDRMPLAELIRRVAESCFAAKVDYLLIEDKARGHDVAQEIMTQYSDAGWQTVLIPANGRGAFSGDKAARLRAVSVMFSGDHRRVPLGDGTFLDEYSDGMIYEPGRDWCQDVIDEICGFPQVAHDDYVDSVSMALSFIRRHGVAVRRVEHDRMEHEAKMWKPNPGVPYVIR